MWSVLERNATAPARSLGFSVGTTGYKTNTILFKSLEETFHQESLSHTYLYTFYNINLQIIFSLLFPSYYNCK